MSRLVPELELVDADIGNCSILFSLQDFKSIPSSSGAGGDAGSLFPSPPFSFYAAADCSGGGGGGGGSSASGRKGKGKNSGVSVSWDPAGGGGSNKKSSSRWKMSAWSSSTSGGGNKPPIPSCWLRLTRIKAEDPPPISSSVVRAYLEAWAAKKKLRSYKRLIRDLDALNHAPALDSATTSAAKQREIKTFLRKCKRHVRRDAVRRKMEPMYNRLFEMAQRTKAADMAFDELVLGLGSARMVLDDDDDGGTVVNGPLLEVRVEVELAPDGALLVRPCEHTGVELNREVLGAIVADRDVSIEPAQGRGGNGNADHIAGTARDVCRHAQAHCRRGELRWTIRLDHVPGVCHSQCRTWQQQAPGYRLVVLLSPSQAVQCMGERRSDPGGFDIKAAGCYGGRSAMSPALSPPLASMSLTHGPNTLTGMSLAKPSISNRFASSFKSFLGLSTIPQYERPLFPLPSSASQERIHRLLADGAPAVVVEGPPGCGTYCVTVK